jgi:hypothetical protein
MDRDAPPMRAARMRDAFESYGPVERLRNPAREVAARRHNPKSIIREVVTVYENVLRKCA